MNKKKRIEGKVFRRSSRDLRRDAPRIEGEEFADIMWRAKKEAFSFIAGALSVRPNVPEGELVLAASVAFTSYARGALWEREREQARVISETDPGYN